MLPFGICHMSSSLNAFQPWTCFSFSSTPFALACSRQLFSSPQRQNILLIITILLSRPVRPSLLLLLFNRVLSASISQSPGPSLFVVGPMDLSLFPDALSFLDVYMRAKFATAVHPAGQNAACSIVSSDSQADCRLTVQIGKSRGEDERSQVVRSLALRKLDFSRTVQELSKIKAVF